MLDNPALYVTFTVPEQHLADVKRTRQNTALKKSEASATRSRKTISTGMLSFIDNSVDSATGTIKLKATFQNPDNRLWPGQFVNVALTLMNSSQRCRRTFASGSDRTSRPVHLCREDGYDRRTPAHHCPSNAFPVEQLSKKVWPAGETLITDGQMRVVPGMKVTIREQ